MAETPYRSPAPDVLPEFAPVVSQCKEAFLLGSHESLELIKRFFDTIGGALPFISQPTLIDEVHRGTDKLEGRRSSRSSKALLNIVFAHALSTVDGGLPEPFYHKALGLLLMDEQNVCTSNLETSQCLHPEYRLMCADFQ